MKEKISQLQTSVRVAPWWVKVIVAVGVLYLLSPIDLIPDFLPMIGWADDLAVLAGLVWLVSRTTRSRDTVVS